jgi:hypothetical protein
MFSHNGGKTEMRHREQTDEISSEASTGAGVHDTVATLTELMSADRRQAGRHRAPVAIPTQKLPTHDTDADSTRSELSASAPDAPSRRRPGAHRAPVRPTPSTIATVTELPTQARQVVAQPVRQAAAQPTAEPVIPHTAEWRASHFPRVFIGGLLGTAIAGTTALAIRYAQSQTLEDFIPLAVGLAVVVLLWGILIASTPQIVRLKGSWLSVHNTLGSARFDLADGLQEADIVGTPESSHWALLLHRPNSASLVLTHKDVVPAELDPIVRHYRTVAERRFAERNARFSL